MKESARRLGFIISFGVFSVALTNAYFFFSVKTGLRDFFFLLGETHFRDYAANNWDLMIGEFVNLCVRNNPYTLYFPYSLIIVWITFFVVTCYKDIRSKNLQYKPFLTFLLGMLIVFNIAVISMLEVATRYQQVFFLTTRES